MADVALLVVGAGPYGVAVAAHARARGIDTMVAGRPMSFWTEHMPPGMFLRSSFDWHLDAAGVDTFAAYAEDLGITAADVDPVPLDVFLGYAAWFQERKHVEVTDRMVAGLTRLAGGFVARLDDGTEVAAERVVAAPGVAYFAQLPAWAAEAGDAGAHASDLVDFDSLSGARVLVVGGRQSAYEWAALLADHGAERVDVVHRHPVPAFDRVSWAFVDPYMDATVDVRGWWRSLPAAEQEAIARQFWEVGRLTLEWWLTPRLPAARVLRWPGTEVVHASRTAGGAVSASLSNGEVLAVDRVVFATGYRTQLANVPYLADLLPEIAVDDGFPVLDEVFQTSVPGLYVPGFAATRDFGPFFGFTKACPAAARLVVDDLVTSG